MITADGTQKQHKRLELLPEEALYLTERGSLFCWKATTLDLSGVDDLEGVLGPPMSVQQAFSEMIGTEDLTLERYQVCPPGFATSVNLLFESRFTHI